jgi:hypothetical protein
LRSGREAQGNRVSKRLSAEEEARKKVYVGRSKESPRIVVDSII